MVNTTLPGPQLQSHGHGINETAYEITKASQVLSKAIEVEEKRHSNLSAK